MTLYRVKDWSKNYEVSDSKKVDGPLSWVAVRTKQDGFGFRRMAQERDRCELFAAWVLIVEIAARQRREDRGKLVRDGRPLTAKALATMTGFPESVFVRAFTFFSEPEQDWLIAEEVPQQPAVPAASARAEGAPVDSALATAQSEAVRTGPDKSGRGGSTLQDITGQDSNTSAEAETPLVDLGGLCKDTPIPEDPIVLVFPTVGDPSSWALRQSKIDEYQQTFPAQPVDAACREARQWCVDNERQRKTAKGMPKFLFGWLARRQDRGQTRPQFPQHPANGYHAPASTPSNLR